MPATGHSMKSILSATKDFIKFFSLARDPKESSLGVEAISPCKQTESLLCLSSSCDREEESTEEVELASSLLSLLNRYA